MTSPITKVSLTPEDVKLNSFDIVAHRELVADKVQELRERHDTDVLILHAYNGDARDCVTYLVVDGHVFPAQDDYVKLDNYLGLVHQYDTVIDFVEKTTTSRVYFDYDDFCKLKELHPDRLVVLVV